MTKRKSLLESILVFGCVIFTAAAIVVGLILFLIQPAEICSLFTSVHTVGLFGFAAGTVITSIITAYVLQRQFSKKIDFKTSQFSKKMESKNNTIRKLIAENKQLKQALALRSLSEEANHSINPAVSRNKDIIGEIEDLSDSTPPTVPEENSEKPETTTTPQENSPDNI